MRLRQDYYYPRHGFWGPLTHELFAVASDSLIFYASVELYKAEREHFLYQDLVLGAVMEVLVGHAHVQCNGRLKALRTW